jgi:hypothetical protein
MSNSTLDRMDAISKAARVSSGDLDWLTSGLGDLTTQEQASLQAASSHLNSAARCIARVSNTATGI